MKWHVLLFIFMAWFLTARVSAGVANETSYLDAIKLELQKSWPTNRSITLVFHGHSVPAGYFRTPKVDTFNAYPHLLHRLLKEFYPNAVINVIVTAIGGENSVQGAARFDREVLSHHPDVLCFDYALNDRGVGLERARLAWIEMIRKAKAANIKVILLSPSPDMAAQLDNPGDPLNRHADQIRQLAAEFNVGLVDSLASFKAEIARGTRVADLMSQSNHPNARGHALIAAELQPWFVIGNGHRSATGNSSR